MEKSDNKLPEDNKPGDEKLSRREALKKVGYAAFASSTLLLLLNNPTKVYAQSPGDPGNPGGGWEDGGGWDDDAWG